MNIYERAAAPLNLALYEVSKHHNSTLYFPEDVYKPVPKSQYILRMMVKNPETNGKFILPNELEWIRGILNRVYEHQKRHFFDHPYVYITVRCGIVTSKTDDEWHVDGFSMRVPHLPEQNYIWSDWYPTQLLLQNFKFPDDFDPMKHNIHSFFQSRAKEEYIRVFPPSQISVIDPYVIHRRPMVPIDKLRKFFRISFVPIEIEDDTCTPNSLLPRKIYGREDIRKRLIPYQFASKEDELAYEMKYGHLF